MTSQHSNDWAHLAEQASNEMDPEKLMELVTGGRSTRPGSNNGLFVESVREVSLFTPQILFSPVHNHRYTSLPTSQNVRFDGLGGLITLSLDAMASNTRMAD